MDRLQTFLENMWERTKRWFANPTRRNITIGVVLALIASALLDVPTPHVSLAAEPLGEHGPAWFTNALLTTIIVDIVLIGLAFLVRSRIKQIPDGFTNFMEFVVEGLYNLTESVAGKNARKFFPWVATIFLFVIVSNYSGLIPGVGSIGVYHEGAHNGAIEEIHEEIHEEELEEDIEEELKEEHEEDEHGAIFDISLAAADGAAGAAPQAVLRSAPVSAEEGERVFVPLFRAPSADLNMTFALALITMVLVQFWGYQALGTHYFQKFFNFNTGTGFMRGIFAFSGILELISEFAKIISFAFRLFGNIFAGEVLLAVMAFLVAFLVPIPFYGLELFVGFIQALVFMMLAVVFFSTAVVSHGDHGDH